MVTTSVSIGAIIGERSKRRSFKLETTGRSIMASRGGRRTRGGKKKKPGTRGGRRRK